jgi:hypothetical protein
MHAVIIDVALDPAREDVARRMLLDLIVPQAKSRAGFTAGYWLRALQADAIRAMQVYESEATARAAAEEIRAEGPPPGAPVTLESISTYEVLAHAE